MLMANKIIQFKDFYHFNTKGGEKSISLANKSGICQMQSLSAAICGA